MQFEVNGQAYFLHFVDDEGRWYVFEPGDKGIQRIPVYVDERARERSLAKDLVM